MKAHVLRAIGEAAKRELESMVEVGGLVIRNREAAAKGAEAIGLLLDAFIDDSPPAERAYLALLCIPWDSDLRVRAQAALVSARDLVAALRGADAQAVQDEFEKRAYSAMAAVSSLEDGE